jgi:hypothetical protein
MINQLNLASESAVTQPSVVNGMGYPNGRDDLCTEPTGWQNPVESISRIDIEKKVSRETF